MYNYGDLTIQCTCLEFTANALTCSLYTLHLAQSRPGLIGPHSVSGHGNTQDWVCWLVRGVAGLSRYPVGSGCDEKRINWMPVDQVARAVIHLSIGSHSKQ